MAGPNDITGTVAFTDGFSAVFGLFAQAVEGVKGSVSSLGSSLGGLKGTASELGAGLKTTFEDPKAGVEQLASTIGGALQSALSSIGPAGAVAAGGLGAIVAAGTAIAGVVFGLADHAANAGEQVLGFSQKTGIAVENVGALQFAVTAAGGSLESISGILQHLTMKEASDQGGKFASALKDIGINASDFAKMDSESKILAIAKGFQAGATSGNAMKDAIDLMGRSGAEAIPLLMKLTPELLTLGEKLGPHWSQDSIAASEAFSVGFGVVKTAIDGVATRIGIALLPAMSELLSDFASSPEFIDGVTSAVIALAHGLGIAIEVVGSVVTGLLGFIGNLESVEATLEGARVTADKFFLAMLEGASKLPGASQLTSGALKQLKDDLDAATAAQKANEDSSTKWSDAATRSAQITNALSGALKGLSSQSAATIETDLSLNTKVRDGAEAADAYAKAVQALVDALEGDSKKTRETSDAINRVIDSGNQDIDVKTRMVAAIESLITHHTALIAKQKEFLASNLDLTAESKKGAEELTKLQNEYAAEVQKSTGETLATKLAANQKWYDDLVATLAKGKDQNQHYDDEVAAAARLRAQKDQEARDAQHVAEEKFADDTAKLWSDYNAAVLQDDNQAWAAKLANVDTWFDKEKAALDENANISWAQYYERLGALLANWAIKQQQIRDDQTRAAQKQQQDDLDLQTETSKLVLARSGDTVNAQIADVQKWYQDLVTQHQKARDENAQFYTDLKTLADTKIQDIIHANDPLWAAWKGLNADMRSSMANTWDQVLSGTKSTTDAMLEPFKDLWTGIRRILAGILADFEQQLFNPLLKLAHNAMGALVTAITGSVSGSAGGSGGGFNAGGLLSGLIGGGHSGAGGGALAGIGTDVTAIGTALPGATAGVAGAAGSAGLFGLGTAATGGILAAVSAAVPLVTSLVKDLFGTAGRDAVGTFAATFTGGFSGLQQQLAALGAPGQQLWINLTQGVGRNNPEQAAAAIKAVQDALGQLNSDIQKYNLTWKDLSDPTKLATGFQQEASGLQKTFQELTSAGYAQSTTVKAMSGDLNQLIADALQTGQKIPANLQPVLSTLMQMGLLTDANKRKMLGLSDTTLDGGSFADVQAAASRYGITLDQLGPKVNQLNIDQAAQQLSSDWKELTSDGEDVGAVMDKMKGKAQDVVTEALKFGDQIPASMQPMIDKMIDAGDLTDGLGNKLTDDSKLNFAKPIGDDLDDLNKTLQNLIQTLQGPNNSLASALRGIGNTVVHPTVQPRYDGSDLPTDYGAAGAIPQAEGGDYLVTRPTLFLAGEAGIERATFSGAGKTSFPGTAPASSSPKMLQPISIQLGNRDLWRAMIEVATSEGVAG